MTVEEVAASMSGAKVFSTVDATSVIYQIKLTEESIFGLLRSTHPLADLNLRGCRLLWSDPPQTFLKWP